LEALVNGGDEYDPQTNVHATILKAVKAVSSSIVWNKINDPNPSQIFGQINANGFVVLQNQAGSSNAAQRNVRGQLVEQELAQFFARSPIVGRRQTQTLPHNPH